MTDESAIVVDEEIAGWRTYRNDILGYSFRFPSEWKFGTGDPVSFEDDYFGSDTGVDFVHSVEIGPDQWGAGTMSEFYVFQFIVDDADIDKVMADMIRLYSDPGTDPAPIIAAAEPVEIGGLSGRKVGYDAKQITGSSTVVGPTEWAFAVRDNRTYVFGLLPEATVFPVGETWLNNSEGFERLLSSVIFHEPQNFGEHVPEDADLIFTEPLDFNGDGTSEFVVEYSVHEEKEGGKQSTRYLKVLQSADGAWTAVKEDNAAYGIASYASQMPSSSQYKTVKHEPASPSQTKDVLFVMKEFFENGKPPAEEQQYRYYVFGQQADGSYGDFSIAKAYLNLDQYLNDDETASGCRLVLTDIAFGQYEGIDEFYEVRCGGSEPYRTFTLNQRYAAGAYRASVTKSEKLQEGYFILNNLLWHDGKRIYHEPIYPTIGQADSYSVGHTLSHDGKLYVYPFAHSCCWIGGTYSPTYFVIDPETDTVLSLETFPNADTLRFFTGGKSFSDALPSPDGEKLAFVSAEDKFIGDAFVGESVWTFDLLAGTEEKVMDIPWMESLAVCEEESILGCTLNQDALFWNVATGELVIRPESINLLDHLQFDSDMESPCGEDDCGGLSIFTPARYDDYWENENGYVVIDADRNAVVENNLGEMRTAGNFVVRALDFNNDGVDEYVMYYNDSGGPHVGLQHDIVKVFRWDGAQWLTDFQLTEGYLTCCDDYVTHISPDLFFLDIDIGADGLWEAFITTEVEYVGDHSSYEYFLLKWDGEKVSPVYYPKDEVAEQAKAFLGENETLGEVFFDPRLAGRVEIWSQRYNARYDYMARDALVGNVTFDLEFTNGAFVPGSYAREQNSEEGTE